MSPEDYLITITGDTFYTATAVHKSQKSRMALIDIFNNVSSRWFIFFHGEGVVRLKFDSIQISKIKAVDLSIRISLFLKHKKATVRF